MSRASSRSCRPLSLLILDLDGYRAGLADRTRMMRAWNVFFDAYPLVLTPFLMRPVYPWNYDAQGRTQT